jgi:hypothetical protein
MAIPQLVEENGPVKNLPLGHFVGGILYIAERIRRGVAVTGEVGANGWCPAVRYDSVGLN